MFTTQMYKDQQHAKFATVVQYKGFVNDVTPITHKCPKCGASFVIAPVQLLAQTVPWCSSCCQQQIVADYRNTDARRLNEQLSLLMPNLKCTQFNGNAKLGKFACGTCSVVFSKLPRAVLAGKTFCERCTEPPKNTVDMGEAQQLKVLQTAYPGGKTNVWRMNLEAVTYKLKGKSYAVHPAYKINDTFVVNADWNSLWKNQRVYVEQAKACFKQGLSNRLLVKLPNGETALSPVNWYMLPRFELEARLLLPQNIKTVRVLSIDPGTTNAAWAVAEINIAAKTYKLLASGKLINTVHDLTANLEQQISVFAKEVQSLLAKYTAQCLCLERYQARGMKGTTIELVNIMIGVAISEARKTQNMFLHRVIPASQWKNAWNRAGDLELYYSKVSCVVHQADAIGIGIYCIAEWFGLHIQDLMGKKQMPGLLKAIKATDFMQATTQKRRTK